MKQIHGETFRADFHFTQSLTSMFLHLELSALLIKSAAGCTVSSTHSKGLEWFLCGVWESKRGWKVTGDSGCVEFCSGRSLIPLWAAHGVCGTGQKTGRIEQNGAILERADFSCFLSLLWKTSWNGIISTVIFIPGFCFVCLFFSFLLLLLALYLSTTGKSFLCLVALLYLWI